MRIRGLKQSRQENGGWGRNRAGTVGLAFILRAGKQHLSGNGNSNEDMHKSAASPGKVNS